VIRHGQDVLAPPSQSAPTLEGFAADVRAGLGGKGQRTLPSKYLYDDLGSALFEAICRLPEYGLTRADARVLGGSAGAIASRMEPPVLVAELGSGTGEKTRALLEALAKRAPTSYFPIDISPAALAQCVLGLSDLVGVRFEPLERDYLGGLAEVERRRRPGENVLVLFVGSTIGNFDRDVAEDFLRRVRGRLKPGDALLLGTDQVKPVPRMLLAYDDPIGVTAAFNLNLLARINRELGGSFDVALWQHVVRWDATERRIEMHLLSREDQKVRIPGAGLSLEFRAGETIWTESSHKFAPGEAAEIALRTGFRCEAEWTDAEWPLAESLLRAE